MALAEFIVVWRVTERCNLGCAFCGYSRHLRRPRAEADPRQVRAFGEVLAGYQAAAGRPVLVSWLGGEPLLWRPLRSLAAAFKTRLGLRLGVTTAGVPLASAEVRGHLADLYDEVTVSVDGVGPAHDRLRGAAGLYERLRAAVGELRRLADRQGGRPLLRANTVFLRGNVTGLEALCRELASWGVQELTFNQLGGNDRPEFYPANRLLPEQADWLGRELPGIRRRVAPLGLLVRGGPRYLERIACTARGVAIPVEDCAPGRDFLFIDERGIAGPCGFTAAGYGVPLAEVATPADLARLPARFAERKRRQALAPCRDCHSTQVFEKFARP
jgi:MoaA/NifB/PqqE/SkfB family radical SAM enzyme